MAKSLDLNVILAARDKITAPLKKINATSTGTARAIKRSQQEIKGLKASQRDISSFRKMDGALKDNSRALSEAQERQRKLSQALKNTKNPTEQMRKQYKKARGDVEKFTRKGQEQRKELGRVRKSLKDAGIDSRNLGDAQAKLDQRMEAANKRIKRQQKYLGQLGKADISGKFGKMTGEVGKFGKRAAMLGGGAAAGIFGIANSTASLGDEVAKTGDKIGIALGPFQELRYAAERSGVSTQKFDSSLERFVKRMGEATQGTGAAKKAYEELGLSAANLSKMTPEDSLAVVADRLNSVENQSQRVAIAAQLFGREGVAMVNMMKDGSAGLKALRKDARDTGYVLSEKAARDAETFKDAMLDAQLGMSGMKNTIGAELMPAVSELMGDLSAWMRENRDRVKAFANEFGERLKAAIPILKNVAVGAASMASTLGAVTSRIATLVGGFDNLGMILAFVFALKPALAIAGFAKALFTAGTAVVGLAGGLPAVAAGVKAIGLALSTTPIGAAIAAIAAAGYLIYKNWDGIATWFKDLWDGVKQAFSGGLAGIGKLILNWSPLGLFYKAFSNVLSWFGVELPGTLTAAGGKMITALASGIKGMIGLPLRAVSGLWDGMKQAFSGGIAGIGKLILNWSPLGLFYKAFSGVMSWFDIELPETLTAAGGKMITALASGIKGMIGLPLRAVSSLWDGIKSAFSGGIAGVGKLVLNWSPLGLFYKAFSGVMSWFDIELPGTLTAAGGKMITALAGGIKGMIGLPLRAVSGLWDGMKQAFSGGIAGIGKLILNWSPLGLFYKAFSGVMSWFGVDLPDSFTGFGKQILDGLVGGLVGGLKKVKDTIVNAGAKTIGWFKETLGIKSPSRVFMAAGNDTLEGYRRGLAQKEPEALKQVNSFGKRMRNAGAGIAMGAAAMPVAAGTVQVDSRPPMAAPAAQAAPAGGDNITINVYPQPEQNAQDIAAEIHRVLAERDRMKARRAGSALYDRE